MTDRRIIVFSRSIKEGRSTSLHKIGHLSSILKNVYMLDRLRIRQEPTSFGKGAPRIVDPKCHLESALFQSISDNKPVFQVYLTPPNSISATKLRCRPWFLDVF